MLVDPVVIGADLIGRIMIQSSAAAFGRGLKPLDEL
jgi:hypothetical protein